MKLKKRKLIIPARIDFLPQVRSFIDHVGRSYIYTNKDVNATKLAVEEACTNIMRHGYKDYPDGKIKIKALIHKYSMTIILIDQGHSFDPRTVNGPDLSEYVRMGKIGGLGIMMIRKLMDEIQYTVKEHGNELRLTKYPELKKHSFSFKIWRFFHSFRKYS
jgi:anti-sigma regulatory factor (Ser/Thr protein kinase)